jgi:hypothetical protein
VGSVAPHSVRQRWRRPRRLVAKRSNGETLRRLRFGALLKLFQLRNRRALLPDNDLGRAQLYELLLSSSPAKMVDTVAMYATWMPATEAEQLIDQVEPAAAPYQVSRVQGGRRAVARHQCRARALAPLAAHLLHDCIGWRLAVE